MINKSQPITPPQSRAARALLAWSQNQLADASGVSKRSIAAFEGGGGMPGNAIVESLQQTLEKHGIQFTDYGGRIGVSMASE